MHKAMKTQSEAAGYTGAFFNLETDGGNWSDPSPGHLNPRFPRRGRSQRWNWRSSDEKSLKPSQESNPSRSARS